MPSYNDYLYPEPTCRTTRPIKKGIYRWCLLLVATLLLSLACLQHAGAQEPPTSEPAPDQKVSNASTPHTGQLVSIDFNNVDINVFIKFISDLTKKNFVVDDKVRGKVTIISPGQITIAEAYKVFESVLEVYGYAAVRAGDIIKIIPAPDARTKSIKTKLEEESTETNDSVVTQIIPLHYADPEEIKRLFTPLVSKNSVILSYQPTNTLIITDVYSNIKRLLHILKSIDVTGVGQQVAIIQVEYADASKLVTLLNTIYKAPAVAKGKPASSGKDITFVADERTNVIVVLASEGDVDNIRKLVKILDMETPKAQSRIHVYYLENAPAEDLAQVLMDIPSKGGTAETKEGKPTAPVVSDKVRITADKATNSLIIMADQEDYFTLEDIIRKIDIPRAMVYIEALIMEVSVDKDFRLGTEWLVGSEGSYDNKGLLFGTGFSGGTTGGDAGYAAVGSTTNPITGSAITVLPPGFSMGLFGETLQISGITFPSIGAIIQAYKKDRDVKIISTPQILTTDNQEAKIYVGQNVPFQTAATASTTGTELYNSYEYRDVGKSLKITPQISKDRMVRLELALEVTDLQSAADNRPTTLKRTVETTAIVKDGNTVVLGGLIDDKSGLTEYRVPCLGDIPFLGSLFRSRAKSSAQSNLYVFLTPRVIQNPDEASRVASVKRNEIDGIQKDVIRLNLNDPSPSDNRQMPPPINEPMPKAAPESSQQPSGKPGQDSSAITHSQPTAPSSDIDGKKDETMAAPADVKRADTTTLSDKPVTTAPPPRSSDPKPLIEEGSANNAGNGYTVEVASVQSSQTVDKMVAELTSRGYAAYAVRIQVDGNTWYHLRVGFFKTRAEADPIMGELRDLQYAPTLIKL